MTPKLNLNPVGIYMSSSQAKLQMCVEAACTKKLWQQWEAVLFLQKSTHNLINVTVPCCTRTGLKKIPSGHLGQVDFPAGQVTFNIHLPNGQGSEQVFF